MIYKYKQVKWQPEIDFNSALREEEMRVKQIGSFLYKETMSNLSSSKMNFRTSMDYKSLAGGSSFASNVVRGSKRVKVTVKNSKVDQQDK